MSPTLVVAALLLFLALQVAVADPFLSTLWTVTVPSMGYPQATTVSPDGAMLFNTDGITVFGFDVASRSVAWTYDLGEMAGSEIEMYAASGPSVLLVSSIASTLLALNATTGTLLWVNTSLFASVPGVLPNGLFLTSTVPAPQVGAMVVIDVVTGEAQLTLPAAEYAITSGSTVVYLSNEQQNTVSVVDVANPSGTRWSVSWASNEAIQLTSVGDRFISLLTVVSLTTSSLNTTVRALERKTGKEVYTENCGANTCGASLFPDGVHMAVEVTAVATGDTSVHIVDLAHGYALVDSSFAANGTQNTWLATVPPAVGNLVVASVLGWNSSLLSANGKAISLPLPVINVQSWLTTRKCVIVPSLQGGYVAFSLPSLALLHQNDMYSSLGPLFPIAAGGNTSTFAAAASGAFSAVTFPSC